jgi:hypothetical protein
MEQIQFATPSELSLLHAALLDVPTAAEAASNWFTQLPKGQAESGFRSLELASRRLLPLVYWNVRTSAPAQWHGPLKAIYYEYWAENVKRFHRLQQLLPGFERYGIATLVLKGAALSVLHYPNMAVRPMFDLDILVPEDRAPEVVDRLRGTGWTSGLYVPSASQEPYFYRHTHAMPFTHPDYGELDLHWHVLAEATFTGADRLFWSGSVPLAVNDIETRALNPTHQLMHTCVHGFKSSRLAPIRWIADAITILRTSEIEWTQLVNLATDLHLTVPLSASLSFLRATFPAPIPEGVLAELAATPVDRAERRYFNTLVHGDANWCDVLVYNVERHRRANRDRNPLLSIPSLPRQLQMHYNLPHWKDLGAFALSRLSKRIRRRIGCS